MSVGLTRRAALGLALLAPAGAFAASRRPWPGAAQVDVSPLRRAGDNVDADFLSGYLPGYLAQTLGPGRSFSVRIDSVTYGTPGSAGNSRNEGYVDTIEGVGRVDGREIPVLASLVGSVALPDIGGHQAHTRQLLLAQSFAQWLARDAGSWR